MQLRGKTAVITGAGGGIGSAIARRYAEEGADVALVDLERAGLEAVRSQVAVLGRNAVVLETDLTAPRAIERMVAEATARLGSIDVLVNNAGVTWHRGFFEIGEEDWDRIHSVNARAAFFCMQQCARQMVAQGRGGSIINMASIAAKGFRDTSNAAYAASKGAVVSMSLIAAHRLGEHSIRVNAICPGVTRTPMLDGIISRRAAETEKPVAAVEQDFAQDIALRRFNETDDVAALAVFLASEGGRNITGQSINLDGGIVMH